MKRPTRPNARKPSHGSGSRKPNAGKPNSGKPTAGKPKSGRSKAGPKKSTPDPATATVILLNKPYGYVSQFSGEGKTLADLVKTKGVYPAGRLDKDSEGLIILTNHGGLQHRISHPDMKWQKSYWVQVEGDITEQALQQLVTGVALKDGPANAVDARRIDAPRIEPRDPPVRYRASIPDSWINLTLAEGRNRQVRRMTAAVGFPTLRLIRHRIGLWDIADVSCGKYQTIHLPKTELSELLHC